MTQYQNIPNELKALPQWVCWRFETRNGKRTKVPVSPLSGLPASVTEPQTWSAYGIAVNSLNARPDLHGIGFVFSRDDPYVGIDIDHCIAEDLSFTEEANQAIAAFGSSYYELSPSGKGLKFWIRGKLPTGISGRKNSVLGVEAYQCDRYFTVTGLAQSPPSIPVVDCNATLQQWFALKFPAQQTSTEQTFDVVECLRSADEIIEEDIPLNPRLQKLFDGDFEGDFPSQSEADFAFCKMLARITGPDPHRIDDVFRESGLYRPKWEREDYRADTIDKAVQSMLRRQSNAISEFACVLGDATNSHLSIGPESMQTPVLNNVISVSNIPPNWAELTPLNPTGYVEMSAEDFPPTLSEFIRAVAARTETPVELPGLMTLGVLAAACQRKYEVSLPEGHFEPLNLWVCPAMGPGNRKTSVVSTVVKPLTEWEQETRSRLRPEIEQNRSKRKSMEKRIDYLRASAAKKVTDEQRQTMLDEVRTLENELPPDEHYPVLRTDDCTPENIAVMMSRNDERMSFISDEGGVFGMMAGRYSRGVPNIEVYLQGHAGSSVRVHRSGREDIDLQAPCLTIAVSPQPAVLEQVAANPAFNGRGLLDRFLFAMPKSRLGYRELTPKPISPEIESSWNRLIKQILDLPQSRNAYGGLMPHRLNLTPDAYKLWKNEQLENEADMRPGNAWGSAPGWASKYPGAVLRIAGLFHVATCVQLGVSPESSEVDDAVMQYAIRIGRVIKRQSGVAFGLMRLDAKQHLAVRVSEWIQCQAKTQFTGREVVRALNGGRSNGVVNDALGILEESGWIRPMQQPEPRGKGRPPRSYEVNPLVFSNR